VPAAFCPDAPELDRRPEIDALLWLQPEFRQRPNLLASSNFYVSHVYESHHGIHENERYPAYTSGYPNREGIGIVSVSPYLGMVWSCDASTRCLLPEHIGVPSTDSELPCTFS
jgi:hypothetical protein